MTESVTLKTRDKRVIPATAEITRLNAGAQAMKAWVVGLGSLVVGLFTILIPIAHFVLPWLIPVIGVTYAASLFKRGAVIERVHGACPLCGAADLDGEGGVFETPMWVRCATCKGPMELFLQDPND